jgi:hypothetical protein
MTVAAICSDPKLFRSGLADADHAGRSIARIDRCFVVADGRDGAFHGLAGTKWTNSALVCLRCE